MKCCNPTRLFHRRSVRYISGAHRPVRRASMVKAGLIAGGVFCGACPGLVVLWPPGVPVSGTHGPSQPHGGADALQPAATPISVSEPASAAIVGLGLAALGWVRLRRRDEPRR